MQVGFIGLGRMGANMVRRLVRGGHSVVMHDAAPDAATSLAAELGSVATAVQDIAGMAAHLADNGRPRVFWMMVPHGDTVDLTIDQAIAVASPGDILVDGGNSYFKHSVERATRVEAAGLRFVDCGTSGGVWGLERGYCLMVGADPVSFAYCEPLFETLAPPHGYKHVGSHGAGHFTKMIHNGIEYALMQAYAEGFEILEGAERFGYDFDLAGLADLWQQGSVIRSWLLELSGRAFHRDPSLSGITGYVEDTGEGRWTVMTAIEEDVPALAITHALMTRFRSRQADSFGARVLAALRHEFGGHGFRSNVGT
jgi:6-phosphogluconate dehydrogenase